MRRHRLSIERPVRANEDQVLALPVVLDPFGEERERDIFRAAAGAPHLFHHPHRAVSIPGVHQNRGSRLELWVFGKPGRDRIARALIIVIQGAVVFGMEIVIEKNCVVRVFTQQLLGLLHILGHVDKVAFEAHGKPFVPPAVIVEKKNPDGITLDRMIS